MFSEYDLEFLNLAGEINDLDIFFVSHCPSWTNVSYLMTMSHVKSSISMFVPSLCLS